MTATRPLPFRARINLHVAAQALRNRIGDEEVQGTRLRHALSSLSMEALWVEPMADLPVPSVLSEETMRVIAPLVAARIAETREPSLDLRVVLLPTARSRAHS
jgi:hypothetical protein